MSELSAQQIKEKIEQIKRDIEQVKQAGDAMQKVSLMYEYIDYLEYELKNAENKN